MLLNTDFWVVAAIEPDDEMASDKMSWTGDAAAADGLEPKSDAVLGILVVVAAVAAGVDAWVVVVVVAIQGKKLP